MSDYYDIDVNKTAVIDQGVDLESIGAANTRTETTSPIIQARRPNSVSSPPHSIVPPAIAIPMRPMAYATGPVSDVAIVRMGVSHGNAPPAAA